MTESRHVKHALSLNDRLKIFSDQLKAQASRIKPSPEKDALLKRARVADTAAQINDMASLAVSRLPK